MIALYVMAAVLILLLMITIHEAGHYTAGKLLGFGIEEFSVGMGPRLLSHKTKSGEDISLRALPLGGYCAFTGEEEEAVPSEEDAVTDSRALPFSAQKPWKRIVVLAAGPLFNMLSAFVFSFIYIIAAGYSLPVVTDISADGGAYLSGLERGDVITAVDGREITFLDTAAELLGEAEGDTVLTVERGGRLVDIRAEKKDGKFGITLTYERRSIDALHAAGYSFPYTFELSGAIVRSFGMLLTGGVPLTDVTGPVGTVVTIAGYAERNALYFLLFLPLIASNLAIFNLLPIPALDGSRIIFALIELIRRKPINKKVEGAIHTAGLIILLALVAAVDIAGMIARSLS